MDPRFPAILTCCLVCSWNSLHWLQLLFVFVVFKCIHTVHISPWNSRCIFLILCLTISPWYLKNYVKQPAPNYDLPLWISSSSHVSHIWGKHQKPRCQAWYILCLLNALAGVLYRKSQSKILHEPTPPSLFRHCASLPFKRGVPGARWIHSGSSDVSSVHGALVCVCIAPWSAFLSFLS